MLTYSQRTLCFALLVSCLQPVISQQCPAGTSGPDGGPCQDCTNSQYKSTVGSAACTSCPIRTGHQLRKQTNDSQCICAWGYTGTAPTCQPCEIGQWKGTFGSTPCTDCVNGKTLGQGAAGISYCRCNEGYTGPNGGTCMMCAAGKYKSVIGDAICPDCTSNTDSATTGATSADCQRHLPTTTTTTPSPTTTTTTRLAPQTTPSPATTSPKTTSPKTPSRTKKTTPGNETRNVLISFAIVIVVIIWCCNCRLAHDRRNY